jgi:hypothetical protein
MNGNLPDEDFPPAIDPYSSTSSAQRSGSLVYGSADIGYNILRGGILRVGAFTGYHYFNETMFRKTAEATAISSKPCCRIR